MEKSKHEYIQMRTSTGDMGLTMPQGYCLYTAHVSTATPRDAITRTYEGSSDSVTKGERYRRHMGKEVEGGWQRADLSLERLATLCIFSLTGLICAGLGR